MASLRSGIVTGLIAAGFAVASAACSPKGSRPEIQTGKPVGADSKNSGTQPLPTESINANAIPIPNESLGLSKEEYEKGKIYVNGWTGESDELPSSVAWSAESVAPKSSSDVPGSGTSGGSTPQPTTPPSTPSSDGQTNPQVVETDDEVIFTIRKGTGKGDWNTQQTTVVAKVGKKFTIQNDDDIVHQWHTNNSTPCNHGNPIQPGGKETCRPSAKYSGSPTLYDHITEGKFYIRAE